MLGSLNGPRPHFMSGVDYSLSISDSHFDSKNKYRQSL